ncbi:MAG TPA: SDR family oxidoreductase [Puia sp.]|nr:SDR family oxidoreductase [Puia sp.]
MDLGIKDKVAFVAASSKGLGKAVALELAVEGVKVIISGRNAGDLEKTRLEIKARTSIDPLAITCDLSVSSERQLAIERALDVHGNVDILVTNSGGPPAGSFDDFSDSDWSKAYQQLLPGVIGLIRGFSLGMKQKKWGRIVCITSMAVRQPVNRLVLSNAIRLSIVGLTKTLSTEMAPSNITVNNIMPGYTETERLKELVKSEDSFRAAMSEIPLGRFAKPDEFAAAVAFLCSDRASYITGTSLPVDGGWIKGIF